ncbi:hypothetical protein [Desulforhopalus sp. 52FAK]
MLEKVLSFLKTHQERATIIGLGLGLFVFVGLGLYLQKSNNQHKEAPPKKDPIKVELRVKDQSAASGQQGDSKKTNSFYLRPSPTELLEQLASMENLQESVAQEKLQYLRVLWPVYFFSLESLEGGGETIVLDISEDGFGIVVQGSIQREDYPQLAEMMAGNKIWVAGEIAAVDPSGTGTVYLNIELLDFSEDGPPSAQVEKPVEE